MSGVFFIRKFDYPPKIPLQEIFINRFGFLFYKVRAAALKQTTQWLVLLLNWLIYSLEISL